MEIGGFFILLVVLIVVAIAAFFLFGTSWTLRRKQLDPEGDKVEGGADGRPRPEHNAVEGEQNARFVGGRR